MHAGRTRVPRLFRHHAVSALRSVAARRAAPNVLFLALALLVTPPLWASSRVTLDASPFEAPGLQGDIVVAVRISPADGVRSIDLVYGYDPAKLTPVGVFRTVYAQSLSLTANLSTRGVVEMHLSGPTPLSGSGEVAWIVLRSDAGSDTSTSLSVISGALNSGAIESSIEGKSVPMRRGTVTLRVPASQQAAPETQITVPILASSFAGGSAFDLWLKFDPAVLRPVSVSRTPLTGCMTSVTNLAETGTVAIALYGVCTVSGSGPLAQVLFDVIGPSGSWTPLNLTRGSINEGHPDTALEDGLFLSCESGDHDGDGFSTCAGDCDDDRAATHPGAPESCNGRDDDCDTAVDDVALPAPVSELQVAKDPSGVMLSWAAVPQAVDYDVVRGDLGRLATLRGDLGGSANLCLVRDSTATQAEDAASSAAASAWYLVRARNCGGFGTYDEQTSAQVGSRDPQLVGAPWRCP